MSVNRTVVCPRCGKLASATSTYCCRCGVALRGPGSPLALLPAVFAGGFVALFGQIVEQLAAAIPIPELSGPESPLFWLFFPPVKLLSTAALSLAFAGGAVAAARARSAPRLWRLGAAFGVLGLACLGQWAAMLVTPDPTTTWSPLVLLGAVLLGALLGGPAAKAAVRWPPFSWFDRILSGKPGGRRPGEPGLVRFSVLFPLVALPVLALPDVVVVIFLGSIARAISSKSVQLKRAAQLEEQEAS